MVGLRDLARAHTSLLLQNAQHSDVVLGSAGHQHTQSPVVHGRAKALKKTPVRKKPPQTREILFHPILTDLNIPK